MLDVGSKRNAVPTLLRRMNERRVLEVLLRRGAASRADLARSTGISAPTISKAVASLEAAGLIESQDRHRNPTGRPGRLYSLASRGARIIGVAIDPWRCCVASSGLDGNIPEGQISRFPTPAGYAELLGAIAERARRLMREQAPARLLGLGLSVPAILDAEGERVLDCPGLACLNDRKPASDLSRRLKMSVVMTRQAEALCLAQRPGVAARGMENFALIDSSADLAAAMVSGGQPVRGQHGLAGALGRVALRPRDGQPGRADPLSRWATDPALAAAVSERSGSRLNIDEALDAIRSGRVRADDLLKRTIDHLAIAISIVVNVMDPEAVFVHARSLAAREDLFDRLVEKTAERAPTCRGGGCRVMRTTVELPCAPAAGFVRHLATAVGPSFT